MFNMLPQTLTYWYKNHLSDYHPDQASGKWHPQTIPIADRNTGEVVSEKPLYVFKAENIGEVMSIDDKAIGHEGFTILSNTKTGNIAMMIESTKGQEIASALQLFGDTLNKVQSLSLDMSPTYMRIRELMFINAYSVVDKFHVLKYVYDAVLEVKARIKKELTAQLTTGKKKTEWDKIILSELELLRRSHYALTQSSDKWSKAKKEIVEQVFAKFEELKNVYVLSQQFKDWYSFENRYLSDFKRVKELSIWYDAVEKSKITELESVVKMIQKHEQEILNFFIQGHTNAKAERLNGSIQRFISNNYGLKNKDFALYRIANYYS